MPKNGRIVAAPPETVWAAKWNRIAVVAIGDDWTAVTYGSESGEDTPEVFPIAYDDVMETFVKAWSDTITRLKLLADAEKLKR